ncbi:MAG: Uma2 family endonuclease [Anaerolineae bacterium]|nr:Uma2 family endonuclease [Anaerolineae bacterium]
MAAQVTRVRFTVDQYEDMGRAGILGEDVRVELVDGEIVQMSPIGARHMACVNRLTALLSQRLGQRYIISPQNPIRLSRYQEPEPDLAVLKWRDDFYASAKPTAADVLLVIEVAETTLEYDTKVKIPRYAQAGVPEAWVADLMGNLVKQYADPVGGVYQVEREYRRGETLMLRAVPELSLDVAAILG